MIGEEINLHLYAYLCKPKKDKDMNTLKIIHEEMIDLKII